MRTSVRLVMVVAVSVSLTACGSNAPSSSTNAPASTAAAEFGVAECDTYMKQYLACLDRMPAEARTQAQQAIDQTKASWTQAASTDQGRAALATTCKAASDAAAPAMRAYGCAW